MHSIVRIKKNIVNETKYSHVVYLGAIGVYKFYFTSTQFLLPIWVNDYAPNTEQEYNNLSNNVHTKSNEWARALIPHNFEKISVEDCI